MGSTRPTDRSIGEATFLPQWMKGKSENTRFDFSEGAFSPPADDTFFLIRYPKQASTTTTTEGFRSITDFLAGKRDNDSTKTAGNSTNELGKQSSYQQYSTFATEKANEPKLVIANKPKINKIFSDEFNSESSSSSKTTDAGRSIVTVASQIMFGKSTTGNFNTAQDQTISSDSSNQQNHQTIKVSKSLPATPMTSPNGTPDNSPKSRRRAYGNRYFTGAFVTDGERQKNGWLLSSILGQSRELIVPKKIEEEEDEITPDQVPTRALNRKKSISSQNLTYVGKEDDKLAAVTNTTNVFQPQPSELREMNFWSPTSM